jgi:hypothetical protein
VSGRARGATAFVSREYQPAPESCARAVELLLKRPAKKEGAAPRAPDDTKQGESNESRGRSNLPE